MITYSANQTLLNINNGLNIDIKYPYMTMSDLNIFVNNSGYTIIDNNSQQIVSEAISWINGNDNGTYQLGTDCVNRLINYKFSCLDCKINGKMTKWLPFQVI